MVAALGFVLAFAMVEVGGDVTCPAPAEVSRLLGTMVDQGAPGGASRARLSRTSAGLHLELVSEGGERLAERDLPGGESCADLAQAAAVIIGAWEADLDPHLTARVALPAPVGPAESAAAVQTTLASPPARPPSFDLGLALIASVAGSEIAPGAVIRAWLAPGGWHTGLSLSLSGVTSRSEAVADYAGAASWRRFTLGAGPELRFEAGHTILAAQAQALAALLNVEGVGLTTTASSSTSQLGTGLGLRAGRPWGTAIPWIGADALLWPGHDRLVITGVSEHGQLPRFEVQVSLGLSLGRFL